MFETWLKTDLQKPIRVEPLSGNLFSGDNEGNLIGVEVLDNGSAATLSGNVNGYVLRADGATVIISGTLSGNKASIVLPTSAYAVVGQESIVIKVGTVTVGACVAYVYRSTTDTIVDPAQVIPSIEELLAQISACETATANANKVANMTVSAEAATGSTPDAVLSETGSPAHKHITFKLVKGDTGDTGAVPNISVGTVTTGAAGTNVSVTRRSGSPDTAPVFDFTIPKGDKGDTGDAFHVVKTYASVSAMNADYSGTDTHVGDYVMIVSSVEDPDNAKVYIKGSSAWSFVVDMSGATGIQGQQAYVWIRYASVEPTQDSDMKTTADKWIGIYSGTASTAPTTYSSYTWYEIKGAKGDTGNTGATGANAYVWIKYSATQPTQDSDMKDTADEWIGIYSGNASSAPTTYTSYTWYKIKGETGSVSNVYGTTIDMSSSDSTKISAAIGAKLDANQGSGNAGKFMRVGSTGAVAYDDPTERYASESNFPATGDAGKLYIAEDTGKIYVWDGTNTEYVTVGGSESQIYYGTSTSSASVSPKKVTISPDFYDPSDIPDGTIICVKFTNACSFRTGLMLNINNKGSGGAAPGISVRTLDNRGAADGVVAPEFMWSAGETVIFIFSYYYWRIIRQGDMVGATASTAGQRGLVPAPASGDQGKFLKGDGTWGNVPNPQVMTGATASTAGAAGLVPAPAAGDQDKVLKGNGTWGTAANTTPLQEGLAIIVDGDTCTTAVPVGGYAYIKNNTHSLPEGMYKNTSASAFPVSGGTADSTVFTAASSVLNAMSLPEEITYTKNTSVYSDGDITAYRIGKIVYISLSNAKTKAAGTNMIIASGFPIPAGEARAFGPLCVPWSSDLNSRYQIYIETTGELKVNNKSASSSMNTQVSYICE